MSYGGQQGRTHRFDRNPIVYGFAFSGSLSNSIFTVRWLYTIPSRRLATLQAVGLAVVCLVPGLGDISQAEIGGGGALFAVRTYALAAGESVIVNKMDFSIEKSGDPSMYGATFAGASGETVYCQTNALVLEFDA